MLFGNRAIHNIKLDPNPDAAGAGGGNGGNGDGGQQQQQQQQQQSSGNNSDDISIDSFGSMWDTPDTKTTTQQQPNQQQPNANDAFANHMKGIDFTNGVDLSTVQADLQEGNMDSMQAAMSQVAQNSYKAAMTNMNQVVNDRVTKAVEQAVAQSSQNLDGREAINSLNTALPFTKEKAIAPLANKVFQQFARAEGATVQSAIKKTKEYFAQTFITAQDDLDLESNQQSETNAPSKADEDWVDSLFEQQ